jgi:hypothetical protein
MIPGGTGEISIQPFPITNSAGDDFLVATSDSRVFWLSVKLERFKLKPLDLPDDFRFREMHVAVRGVFFIQDRGQMHRLDWEVIKDSTDRVTPEMLVLCAVQPIPALLEQSQRDDENDGIPDAKPDVRPDKVAFGLVHALLLWVQNDPDRKGELKAMLSEISCVLQETHEIKKKIATFPVSANVVSSAALPVREQLLRDALVREVEDERENSERHNLARRLTEHLGKVLDAREELAIEKTELVRELEELKLTQRSVQEEVNSLQALRDDLRRDVNQVQPMVEDLRTKIAETSESSKRRQIEESMREIDTRLLEMASELKAKKMLLNKVKEDRDTLMNRFHDTFSINL